MRKTPLRRCLGCMEMKAKNELIRLVKNKQGELSVDTSGKAQGRGAYLCRNIECLEKARRARRFEREFSMRIPDGIYEETEAEIRGGE